MHSLHGLEPPEPELPPLGLPPLGLPPFGLPPLELPPLEVESSTSAGGSTQLASETVTATVASQRVSPDSRCLAEHAIARNRTSGAGWKRVQASDRDARWGFAGLADVLRLTPCHDLLSLMGRVHVVHEADGNVVARLDASVLVFVRTRPLTVAALDAIESVAHKIEEFRRGPVGALAVIDGRAGLSDNALLTRQRKFLNGFVRADGDVYLAMVVQGDSVQSIAMRAVVRLFMLGKRTCLMSARLEDAAAWLGKQTGEDAEELVATVRLMFERARQTPS